MSKQFASEMVKELRDEVRWTERGHADEDAVYLYDLVRRILAGLGELDQEDLETAKVLMQRVEAIYPSVSMGDIDPTTGPDVGTALSEVQERARAYEVADAEEDLGEFAETDEAQLLLDE